MNKSNNKKNKSSQAFSEIVRLQGKFIKDFIYKNTWDKQDVDDIYQITLMEAFKSFSKFRGESKPRTWVCGIALIIIKNYSRRKKKNALLSLESVENSLDKITLNEYEEDPLSNPDTVYHFECLNNSISNSVKNLPNSIKDTFQLVVYNGLSYEEAAEESNIPIGTVRSRLSRARDIIKCKVKID